MDISSWFIATSFLNATYYSVSGQRDIIWTVQIKFSVAYVMAGSERADVRELMSPEARLKACHFWLLVVLAFLGKKHLPGRELTPAAKGCVDLLQ